VGDAMKDNEKTREQLVHELTELRSQNAELKKSTTESISAELAAKESSRYAESIVETVRGPLLVLDEDLKIISANRNFYRTFKVTPGETIGTFIYDLGNKQWDIPRLRELLEEVLPEKQAFDDFEVAHDFQDIGHRIMLLNACRIYRKDIGANRILLAIEDITERKRLEDLLTESEERYRRLFETASDGIVLLEKREGKITNANSATEKMLGYNNKESIGHKLQDIGIELGMDDFQTTMHTLNKNGIINYDDVPVKTKSGQHIDTDIYLVDRARLVQCNIRDITGRKKAEELLRESEETYRVLFEGSTYGILVTDIGTARFVDANLSICRMLGYSRAELLQLSIANIHPKDWQDHVVSEIEAQVQGGQPVSHAIPCLRKDGTVFHADIVGANTIFHGRKCAVGFLIDVTDRKRAEEDLKQSKGLLESVINSSQDLILVIDRDLRILMSNWKSPIYAGHTEFPIGSHCFKAFIQRDTPCEPCHALGVFNTGEPTLVEYYNQSTKLFKEVNAYPIFDNDKHVIMVAEHVRDITERKRGEEKLKAALQSLKNALSATIQVIVSSVESRDPYTAGHQVRSANLARAIATEMGLSQEKIEGIRTAGSIHDLGKLSVPAEILSKPTKLSEIEFSLIKEHARNGYEILKDVESSWPLAEIVYQHHERMDGSGYPRRLKGDGILIEARILAVADVMEAMTSHRPYRPSLGINAALDEIEKNKGVSYDKAVVDACLRLFREKGFKFEGI
jgi:PAS domain S-box-containing protein